MLRVPFTYELDDPIVEGMSEGLAIVPGNGTEGYVELARSKQGRIFKKHILNYGDLLYPGVKGGKVTIDDNFADTLIANFTNKVCDIVQVPTAGDNNEHSEDPMKNIGEVIGLSKENGKVYAHIDARRADAADALGKTLLGASAMMHMNYTDTRTGKAVGPTLLHVAVTNRPYVTDLEEYKELGEVVAASADGNGGAVLLTASQNPPKEKKMSTLDELFAELRTDHGIDVPALQEQAGRADQGVALSNKITETLAEKGIVKLSHGGEASSDDVVDAVTNIYTQNVELTNKVNKLTEDSEKSAAVARVDALVAEGRILPKNKDAQVKLLLSNVDLFEELLPEKPLVKLSNAGQEQGFETVDDEHEKTVDDEITRLTASVAKSNPGIVKA